MIQLYNLSKVYTNGVVALANVTLTIPKGEFAFLVGPSGAGKSTFIKMAIRSELPTEGTVIVGRKNVAQLRQREIPLFRRNIGVIFQDYKLLPNKTVFENVAFALEVTETNPRETAKQVPVVLDLVGLADRAGLRPAELSGGEQQRVSLARAIVNRPLLLLADEPTGNLDPDTSWGIMDLLLEINKRGTTVVMATHNREVVNRMRRRVIALEGGRLVRDEPRGVYELES